MKDENITSKKEEFDNHNESAKSLKTSVGDGKVSRISQETYSTSNTTKIGKIEPINYNNLNSSIRKIHSTLSPVNYNTNLSFNTNFHTKSNTGINSTFFSNTNRDNIRFINREIKFPYVKLSADYTLTVKQINRIFVNEVKNLGFYVKGSDSDELIFAEKKNFDLLQSLLDCFRSVETSRSNSNYTTIKLVSKLSDTNKLERIIEIEGLSGKKEVISMIIENVYKKLKLHGKKLKLIKYQEVNLSFAVKQSKSYSTEKLPYLK